MREDAQHLVKVKVTVRVGVGVRVGARLGLRVRVRNAQHRCGQCRTSLATGVWRHRRAALVPSRATGATALAALAGGATERPLLPLVRYHWRGGDGGTTAAIVILRHDEGGRLQQ
eukprot:scaffold2969_cov72-Phaeocystis_antarctica.AAC.3